jgi:hypothetical protein
MAKSISTKAGIVFELISSSAVVEQVFMCIGAVLVLAGA